MSHIDYPGDPFPSMYDGDALYVFAHVARSLGPDATDEERYAACLADTGKLASVHPAECPKGKNQSAAWCHARLTLDARRARLAVIRAELDKRAEEVTA